MTPSNATTARSSAEPPVGAAAPISAAEQASARAVPEAGDAKIVVRNLYKVFGSRPERALEMLRQGMDKDTIHQKTGLTVGVQDASFSVRPGEIFVVMGLSGSGKSTLVRLLNRLIEPTAGEVLIDGRDITKMSEKELIRLRREDMGMVFQSFALMPHQTVAENAAFGLEVAGMKAAERRTKALQALEKVGLAQWADSYPRELSGGMQQRVGLARALAQDPSILLMDEAFSALDPLIRAEMQDELLKLQEDTQRTIIFISHDLDEAIRIGDRIAIMEGGRIVQVGTPDEILQNPADEYVRSFFRGVDVSKILSASDVARKDMVTFFHREEGGVRAVLERLRHHDQDHAYIVDRQQRLQGVVSVQSLTEVADREVRRLKDCFLPDVEPVAADAPLESIIGRVAASPVPLPVVDEAGIYKGTVTRATLLEHLDRTR